MHVVDINFINVIFRRLRRVEGRKRRREEIKRRREKIQIGRAHV